MKELKEKLMSELKEYGRCELTSGTLDIIDKLAHALKNVMRIEEYCKDDPVDYEKEGNAVISELETVLEKLKSM
jgi:hypothetical protein